MVWQTAFGTTFQTPADDRGFSFVVKSRPCAKNPQEAVFLGGAAVYRCDLGSQEIHWL
jgi:hypothetical protein